VHIRKRNSISDYRAVRRNTDILSSFRKIPVVAGSIESPARKIRPLLALARQQMQENDRAQRANIHRALFAWSFMECQTTEKAQPERPAGKLAYFPRM